MDFAVRLQYTTPATYRFEGTIRVVVIENPHARIPFPRDVFRQAGNLSTFSQSPRLSAD